MKKSVITLTAVFLLIAGIAIAGCSSDNEEGVGTLKFEANGEDFVRQGFVSKDGWHITFDHVYVNLDQITAYQTDPPYNPHDGHVIESSSEVALDNAYTIDLAQGDEDAPPILTGEVNDAPIGHYNAISWKMIEASSGPAEGYSLVIIGSAEKDAQITDFTIKIENEYALTCGEFVGEMRKGIVEEAGVAEVEMTFHFDHVFGDAGTPLDDDLNLGAVGFAPFAAIAESGQLEEDLSGLSEKMSADDYQALLDILPTLGHTGEGHCHCE